MNVIGRSDVSRSDIASRITPQGIIAPYLWLTVSTAEAVRHIAANKVLSERITVTALCVVLAAFGAQEATAEDETDDEGTTADNTADDGSSGAGDDYIVDKIREKINE
jgi:hypothetical protein